MEKMYAVDLKQVGVRIREARRKIGLTQASAAELASISSQYWSLLETGKERASVTTYKRIADIIGLTFDDIFYDDALTMHLNKTFSKEGILDGCTDFEKMIIGETVLALKNVLTRNRFVCSQSDPPAGGGY